MKWSYPFLLMPLLVATSCFYPFGRFKPKKGRNCMGFRVWRICFHILLWWKTFVNNNFPKLFTKKVKDKFQKETRLIQSYHLTQKIKKDYFRNSIKEKNPFTLPETNIAHENPHLSWRIPSKWWICQPAMSVYRSVFWHQKPSMEP